MKSRRLSAAMLASAASLSLAATATAQPWAQRASVATAAHTRTPVCGSRGLVISLDTNGSGAAGSVFYRIDFTNLTGHRCTLNGYPRVAAISPSGRQLGRASGRFVSRRSLVTLADRGTASAVLQIVDVENFPASTCRPVTAAGLGVFPPHQRVGKMVQFAFRACSRSGPQYLFVQAVRPRA